jgi:hypothetical protein
VRSGVSRAAPPWFQCEKQNKSPAGATLSQPVSNRAAPSGLDGNVGRVTQGDAPRLKPFRFALGWYGAAPLVLQKLAAHRSPLHRFGDHLLNCLSAGSMSLKSIGCKCSLTLPLRQ